jgi:hypothetical protein
MAYACLECKNGFFLDSNNICQSCSMIQNCISCSPTSAICLACLTPFKVYSGAYNSFIENSKVFDAATTACRGCSTTFASCFGNLDTQFLSYYPGYYLRTADNSCQPCDTSCLKCSSPGNICITCKNILHKLGDYCYSDCPSPYLAIIIQALVLTC